MAAGDIPAGASRLEEAPVKVLVTAASKYGSTQEVGESIANTLRDRGLDTDMRPAGEVTSLDGYDAVVLGSAVYAGHWRDEAMMLVEDHEQALADRRVWLFSSGPLGSPELKPEGDPIPVPDLMRQTGAEGHRVFPGKLDKHALGLGDKAIVFALRVDEGDYRDWDLVRDWANGVADRLLGADVSQR